MGTRHDIMKAFTWRFVLDELESSKSHIEILNLATVDGSGVNHITIFGVFKQHDLYSVQLCLFGSFHVKCYSYRRGL